MQLNTNLASELLHTVQKKSPNKELSDIFNRVYLNTLQNAIKPLADSTYFVLTGDIPAMWLRDSACQIKPYLKLVQDPSIEVMFRGVIEKQLQSILLDPYANAFNETANGRGHQNDLTDMHPAVWERKYELDSLCYPIQLSYLFWKKSGRTEHFNTTFLNAVKRILDVWKIEQNHGEYSSYRFDRMNCPAHDTLSHDGLGSPVAYTGMTWSGFRPSDDGCTYGYHIPSNMFAVVVLGYLQEIMEDVYADRETAKRVEGLKNEIDVGIKTYGIVDYPSFGPIFAYETDGLGNYNLMDDANVPSLLAIPYLGYTDHTDVIYKNTRAFILSKENPYYYEGIYASGIGSPHTPENFVWPISLAIQGITSGDQREKERLLTLMAATDGGTGLMHESFDVNNHQSFTRPWFSWANAMYCELMLDYCGL